MGRCGGDKDRPTTNGGPKKSSPRGGERKSTSEGDSFGGGGLENLRWPGGECVPKRNEGGGRTIVNGVPLGATRPVLWGGAEKTAGHASHSAMNNWFKARESKRGEIAGGLDNCRGGPVYAASKEKSKKKAL